MLPRKDTVLDSAVTPGPSWYPLQPLMPPRNLLNNGNEDSDHSSPGERSLLILTLLAKRLAKPLWDFPSAKILNSPTTNISSSIPSPGLDWACYLNAVLTNTLRSFVILRRWSYFIKRLRSFHELSLRGLHSVPPFWCILALLQLTKTCLMWRFIVICALLSIS